jgi:CBS domain-containing protein
MTTVQDLIKIKGKEVWHVTPATTVLDALNLMAEKDIGALLVLQGEKVVGIVSERDFARSIAKTGKCLVENTVEQYMTKYVFGIAPDQSIEDCMALMSEKHIRHLPVLDDGKLVGLISISDVVRELISSKDTTIHSLENYIEGRGYGQ